MNAMRFSTVAYLLGWLLWGLLPLHAAEQPEGFPVAVQVIGPDAALNETIARGLRQRVEKMEAVRLTETEPWCTLLVLAQPTPEDAQHPRGCVLAITHTNRLNIVLLLTKLKGAQSKTEREVRDLVTHAFSKEEPLRYLNAVHMPDTNADLEPVLDNLAHDFEARQIVRTRELLLDLQKAAKTK